MAILLNSLALQVYFTSSPAKSSLLQVKVNIWWLYRHIHTLILTSVWKSFVLVFFQDVLLSLPNLAQVSYSHTFSCCSCLVFKSANLRELVNDHQGKIQGQKDLVWKGRAHHTRDVHWSKNRTACFKSCLIAHHTSRPCSKDSSGSAIQKTPFLTQTAESLKVSIGVPNLYHHPVS